MSIWTDVRFDAATAHTAARELRSVADDVEAAAERRADLADDARDGWTGQLRAGFDDRVGAQLAEAGDLVAALRAAAVRIEDELAAAMAEQRRRVEARLAEQRGAEEAARRRERLAGAS